MVDRIVGVDLGGTNIRVAVADANGALLKQAARPTLAARGPEAVVARIVATIRETVEDWSCVRGIGLGAPGPIDTRRGVILEAPNLPGMFNYPLQERLEAHFPVPVFVGNDANLAALGEHRYGAGRGVANMTYITVSTGIGGGIISNGKLFLGWRGFAGEVGHITLEAHGPICSCGNVGCLEVLASGPAIARDAREALDAGANSQLTDLVNGDLASITAEVVTRAAEQGDALAEELLRRAGFYVGLGVVSLQHVLDTELFVFGGGVAVHAWDYLYPSILAVLDKHGMPAMRKDVRIARAELGGDVGLIGAVALVMDNVAAG